MKFSALFLFTSTLALSTPAVTRAAVSYGGGHSPALASSSNDDKGSQHQAAVSHRRHHVKAASSFLSSVETKATQAAKRAVTSEDSSTPEVAEENEDESNPSNSNKLVPHGHAHGVEPVVPGTLPVVGNATSPAKSAPSSKGKFPDQPAYAGPAPLPGDSGSDSRRSSYSKRQQVECQIVNGTMVPLNQSTSAADQSTSSGGKKDTRPTGWSLKGLKVNGVAFGFLPDDGSGGGQAETVEMIEAKLGAKMSAQGWYAQAGTGKPFDGSQFEARRSQIMNSDAVFQATVMPVTWKGFTWEDNSEAVRVANYLQKWIDAGKEVWLRFAHEVNYYQTENTYQGGIEDFQLGWAVMAKARNDLAPDVKVEGGNGGFENYDRYYPEDPNTVDLIGVDYYPKMTSGFDFLYDKGAAMKQFHDK
ncbi:hypothetical protein JCM8097_001542 [Rhodosporidiobolus ruineniae]